jgi:hypothetical protein
MDRMRAPAFCALSIALSVVGACEGTPTFQPTAPSGTGLTTSVQSAPLADTTAAQVPTPIPEWISRIQTSAKKDIAGKPNVAVSTVQPLLQTEDKRDTLFLDLRAKGDQKPDELKAKSNVGIGYRRLISKNLMAGIGGFYDRELSEPSQRASAEGELNWRSLSLGATYHLGLDGGPEAGPVAIGRALDGYQIRLASQLPYLPWAKASIADTDFFPGGDKDSRSNRTTSMQLGLTRNLQLDAGVIQDSLSEDSGYVKLTFRIDGSGAGLQRYLFSRHPMAPVAFESRDLPGTTLSRVPHSEDIVRGY